MKPTSMQPTVHSNASLARTHLPRWSAIGLAALVASGCSVLEEDKVDYKSAKPVSTLEVPPDLTQLTRESRYNLPGGAVTASGFAVSQPTAANNTTAPSQSGDVRIERAGTQRWLVVDRAPETLWDPVREFWQESGFQLVQEQEKLGLIETEWNENRAKLPQDIIRSTIGKVLDSLYSTGERDKFRTRLERNDKGGTDIFISHRGMQEVYTDAKKEGTIWQPRPTDVDLEAEFLRRLMLKLGVSKEQAKAQVAAGAVPPVAHLNQVDNQTVLQLDEGFDRAWRRVGLALDRSGFTVEDRNRSQGVYYVRYVPSNDPQKEDKPGFFGKLFGGSTPKDTGPVRYQIVVKTTGGQTAVSVQAADGQRDVSANAKRILQVISEDLK